MNLVKLLLGALTALVFSGSSAWGQHSPIASDALSIGIIRAKLGHEGYKKRHSSLELIEQSKQLKE